MTPTPAPTASSTARRAPVRGTSRLHTAGFLLLAVGGLVFFLVFAVRYFGTVDDPHFGPRLGVLRVHIAFGAVALLLGPLQFVEPIRRRRIGLHRWIGRTYLVGVAVGAATGLVLSLFANGGLPGRIGFAGLSVAWLVTSAVAWAAIRRRRVAEHRRWMIRSYVVTLAFVWVRLLLGLGLASGADPQAVFGVAAWASWVLPLVVVEGVFARRGGGALRPRRARGETALEASRDRG